MNSMMLLVYYGGQENALVATVWRVNTYFIEYTEKQKKCLKSAKKLETSHLCIFILCQEANMRT
ncbi:UNVERIFIED_CONTAM: hypothetical protein FKN15_018882 [Acipenser sinensis]